MSEIKTRLEEVKRRIQAAAKNAGRDPSSVALVAVSKTVDVGRIREAIEAGVDILGENRVQEAREKVPAIGRKVQWHLIGNLQRNKVKYIFDLFDMVQSADSFELALEISERGKRLGKSMDILLEVNLGGEGTKIGVEPEKAPGLVERISSLDFVRLKGLMTMPPLSADPEDSRPYFVQLRKLRDRIWGEKSEADLSMGMSTDYWVAIEEGATIVRIGTAIFGRRP